MGERDTGMLAVETHDEYLSYRLPTCETKHNEAGTAVMRAPVQPTRALTKGNTAKA